MKYNLSEPLPEYVKTYAFDVISKRIFIDDSQCWNWQGHITDKCYSVISVMDHQYYGHRLSFAVFIGVIPENLTIDHLCKNRKCINPTHMEVVTRAENALRGESSPAQNARKLFCKRGHVLQPIQEHRRDNNSAKRHCPICYRIDALEWNRGHRERKNENNNKYSRSEKGKSVRRARYALNRDQILKRLREKYWSKKQQEIAA